MVLPVAMASIGSKLGASSIAGTLGSIGSALGGLGSLAGGLGLGGSKTSWKDHYEGLRSQSNEMFYQAAHLPKAQVQGFKKAGIHPLYGMGGGNALSVQQPSINQGGGKDFAAMGQGLDRALNAGQNNRTQKLLEEGAQLDLQRKRLENQHLEMQIAGSKMALTRTAGVPPISGNRRSSNVLHEPSRQESAYAGTKGGIAAATPPAIKAFRSPSGHVIFAPNADTMAEATEGVLGSVMVAPQLIADYVRGVSGHAWKKFKTQPFYRWHK